eukprot:504658_1
MRFCVRWSYHNRLHISTPMHHTQQTHSPNYGQYDPYAAGPPRPEPIGIQVSQEIDEDEETRKNWQLDDEVEVFSGGNVEYRNDGNLAGRWTVHHKSASATSCVLRNFATLPLFKTTQ